MHLIHSKRRFLSTSFNRFEGSKNFAEACTVSVMHALRKIFTDLYTMTFG